MGYQREQTTSDLTVHMGAGETEGDVKVAEHEYSDGPYAVVTLKLPGTSIILFPGKENVESLAATLVKMGAELTAIAETLKVSALED